MYTFLKAFSMIQKAFRKVYILAVEFDMAWAIKYSGWWKGVSAPGLYILVYADRLTMSYTQRLLKHFENAGYYTLGVSNCPGCRPKDCTVVRDELCSKPKKRRFSVEATGIDCNALHWRMFDESLPWWHRTPEHMPCKMVRYAAVSTDKPLKIMDQLLFDAMSGDKSYCNKTPSADGLYHVDRLEVPAGCYDAGHNYSAYRIPVEEMKKRDGR